MKRASADIRQSCAVYEEARASLKHQTLLKDFLQLQKMKSASVDFRQSCAVDAEARASLKHQTLLQDFLQLEKRLKKKMQRASADFRQSCVVDEEARTKLKHQTLLQDFLQLQKEFVSQKRKLPIPKQKRDTLLAEVRFLSWRTRCQLKYQSPKFQPVKDPVHRPNLVVTRKMHEREGNCNAYKDALENPCPVWVSITNRRDKEEGEGEE
ncbi:unnamed protein product [Ilex paraguariensis]|uniref:Uncharacterized protein n=1 Tax=Ilex paraguariensis TaxID=185542 RepID=A0ABC8U2R1_9AQUA